MTSCTDFTQRKAARFIQRHIETKHLSNVTNQVRSLIGDADCISSLYQLQVSVTVMTDLLMSNWNKEYCTYIPNTKCRTRIFLCDDINTQRAIFYIGHNRNIPYWLKLWPEQSEFLTKSEYRRHITMKKKEKKEDAQTIY